MLHDMNCNHDGVPYSYCWWNIIVKAMICVAVWESGEFDSQYWCPRSYWGKCFELTLEIQLMSEIKPSTGNSVDVWYIHVAPIVNHVMYKILTTTKRDSDIKNMSCHIYPVTGKEVHDHNTLCPLSQKQKLLLYTWTKIPWNWPRSMLPLATLSVISASTGNTVGLEGLTIVLNNWLRVYCDKHNDQKWPGCAEQIISSRDF